MNDFYAAGERRAFELGNRGPLRFDADGNVAADILDAYWRTGFYVFEGLLSDAEMAELRAEFDDLLTRAPTDSHATTDAEGRPAAGTDLDGTLFRFAKPLTDPYGATDATNGRYQVKMTEPERPSDAPEEVLLQIGGILQFLYSTLRIYGHPDLLKVAEAVNGPDFTPFTEVIWIKPSRLGAAVSWHQDGTTHWDNPDLDAGTHGFNFMVNLYPTNPENGLWVVPGTHHDGKADIKAMVDASGSDRLDGAVPMLCQPGDVAICNRQVVHGSFPNTSDQPRATFVLGFHRRRSVEGVKGWAAEPYDAERLHDQSRIIALAIDARRQKHPDETPYRYAPFADAAEECAWNESSRQAVLKNYHKGMIGI